MVLFSQFEIDISTQSYFFQSNMSKYILSHEMYIHYS